MKIDAVQDKLNWKLGFMFQKCIVLLIFYFFYERIRLIFSCLKDFYLNNHLKIVKNLI